VKGAFASICGGIDEKAGPVVLQADRGWRMNILIRHGSLHLGCAALAMKLFA
jgi:hypothetical protein